jgi:GAF domain-containing protein
MSSGLARTFGIAPHDGDVVSMAMYTSESVRQSVIASARNETIIFALLAIGLEFLVLFPMLYWLVLRRVKRLGRAATAVAEGDFTVRLPEADEDPGRDELAHVAREFDRMIATVSARTKQQAAVASLGQHALAGTDLSHLLDEAAELVAEHLDVGFSAVLELGDDNSLVLRAGRGWRDGAVGFAAVDVADNSQSGFTLVTDEPVVMADIKEETRFTPSEFQVDNGIVSSASVVIPGQEHAFGVLSASSSELRDFTKDDLNFLQAVSSVLAAGIERKRAEEQVAFMAHHDELTQLPNRAMFEELLDLALARARRNDMAVTVLFMDLDNFKLVNDSLGHAAGDDLLAQLQDDRVGDVVVLDNLGAHRASHIEEIARACKATVIWLPPYSPDFSPIEPMWAKLKTY